MQHEGLLPPVSILQKHTEPKFIDGWNANFLPLTLQDLRIPLNNDFRKHLIGFFKFYGFDFDYQNYVICCLTGTKVPKHIFDHGREGSLPPVFSTFIKYMKDIVVEEADEVDELFSNYKPLVVQDPFELIHNVGKGVQEAKLLKIINYMQCTHEVLLNAQF
jgi:hypothetical protein